MPVDLRDTDSAVPERPTDFIIQPEYNVSLGDYFYDVGNRTIIAPHNTLEWETEGGRVTLNPFARALESCEADENVRVVLLSNATRPEISEVNEFGREEPITFVDAVPSTSGTVFSNSLYDEVPQVVLEHSVFNEGRSYTFTDFGREPLRYKIIASIENTYCHEYQCGFCTDTSVCPNGALDYADGYSVEGERPIKVYTDMCDGCRNCENMCPHDKIKTVGEPLV